MFDPYLLIPVLALLLLDVLTTLYVLSRMPGGQEGNGIMRWLMDRIGVGRAHRRQGYDLGHASRRVGLCRCQSIGGGR